MGPARWLSDSKRRFRKLLQDVYDDPRGGAAELILGRAAIDDCTNYRTLERLSMYERRIESSMLRTLDELESRQVMREIKEREICKEQAAQAAGFEAVSRTIGEMADLKKQSQFAPVQVGANSSVKGAYGNKSHGRARASKAKQSQSPADGDSVQRVADSQQRIDIVNRK
jgi:hypothetical protein